SALFERFRKMSRLIANVAHRSGEESVDKIRFSITHWGRDIARLQQDQSEGFLGRVGWIVFGLQQELELFIIAARSYVVALEGDLEQTDYDDVGNHSMRKFNIGWSVSVKQAGTGSGVIKLINPNAPENPCLFYISVGPCQCRLSD
ncbi:MAG: hypothetical protein K2Z81_05365, partial [Cyanobacteria bacterium]|nr:hypothetical protein [Cyanobacteriota bacterium]